jgi:ABC-type iron transport system FetAB permease component
MSRYAVAFLGGMWVLAFVLAYASPGTPTFLNLLTILLVIAIAVMVARRKKEAHVRDHGGEADHHGGRQ